MKKEQLNKVLFLLSVCMVVVITAHAHLPQGYFQHSGDNGVSGFFNWIKSLFN